MTLVREPWIDATEADLAARLEPFLSAIPIRDWPRCLGDVIEQHHEAWLAERPALDRDALGRAVRDAWVERCRLKPDTRPDLLLPFEALAPFDQETDRHIGDAVARHLCAGLPTAEPAPGPGLLLECREWVERCRCLLSHKSCEDALAAQDCLERIDAALAGAARHEPPDGLIAPSGAGQTEGPQQKGVVVPG